MPIQRARGTRDLLPEEKIAQQDLVYRLTQIFERYGFSPLDTPAIERFEVLASKYAGGEEILKETFKLTDQGGRELGLRYDLSVPLARVIAMNPHLRLPFKRYQCEKVWRDGPLELARYREFLQCDVDVIGVAGMIADAEILSLLQTVYQEFGIPVSIVVNHRKLLNGLIKYVGIIEKRDSVILIIDKLLKIGETGVKEELINKGISEKTIDQLLKIIKTTGNNQEKLDIVEVYVKNDPVGMEGLKELRELLSYCQDFGIENITIDLSLARGLVFYTGPVYEVYAIDNPVKSSLAGGGRYDKIIGKLIGGNQEYPATGVSMGIDRIYDALKLTNKLNPTKTVAKLLIVSIRAQKEAIGICQKLRAMGIPVDLDLMNRHITKNMKYANALKIPFVLIIGQKELEQGNIRLRDMKSGKEYMIKYDELTQIKKIVMDSRKG